ncbi:acyltransferase family protein [Kordiimonas pumila]|uniref:Acyltransferase family protein n=1 Tax=Kordiimonas pumila TaxID=2161677 RepID=A0ABV7D1F6_9PROT|nr:acyltransferase family protein [Kordiimonas pumila]
MQYRREIDGLRSLAVIPVILCHAGLTTFSGGFIGVDVFFVISGYLITSIVISSLDAGTFSLLRFYERRARRILPSLIFMVMLVTLLAISVLTPSDLRDFFKSIIAVATFTSNIFFLKEVDYFAKAAELKPLLHTWSLSVEEQYYIMFPAFLLLFSKYGQKWVLGLTILAVIISITVSQIASQLYPFANFYLLPSRAWEILSGALVAFYMAHTQLVNAPSLKNQLFSILGLGLILFSIFVYDDQTPLPSFYTLVPILGTIFILVFATNNTYVYKILSTRLLVGTGIISYNLYLWHQPLISLLKYKYGNMQYYDLLVVLAILTTVIMAVITHYLVEKPFRYARGKVVLKLAVTTISLLIIVPFIAIFQLNSSRNAYAGEGVGWGENQHISNAEVILYGDSHALQYFKALNNLTKTKLIAGGDCIALPGIINKSHGERENKRHKCLSKLDYLTKELNKATPPKMLVIAYRWYKKRIIDIKHNKDLGNSQTSEIARNAVVSALLELIRQVPKDITILIIGNVPANITSNLDMQYGIERCRSYANALCPVQYEEAHSEGIEVNQALQEGLKEIPNIYFIDPTVILCQDGTCYNEFEQHILYSDDSHLTEYSAEKVIRHILPLIEKSTNRDYANMP